MKLMRRASKLLDTFYYWLRTHTINRYHIINIKNSVGYKYKWGWIDRSEMMLIANFKLLCDYVEKEKPFDHFTWEGKEHIANEIRELYDWWTKERLRDLEACSKLGEDGEIHFTPLNKNLYEMNIVFKDNEAEKRFDEYCRRSRELEEKDQIQFMRLAKIREYLWT